MFSGLVEAQVPVLSVRERADGVELRLARPGTFTDVKTGDSIAVNGICLTVEALDQNSLQFTLGRETLLVTGWNSQSLSSASLNVERSIAFGDRLHGHLVSGHVDAIARVLNVVDGVGWRELSLSLPPALRAMVWQKGSIAVNGVSLTVNRVTGETFEVGLIPETLKRTNLAQLRLGDQVNLEADYMARGLAHYLRERELQP